MLKENKKFDDIILKGREIYLFYYDKVGCVLWN